MFQVSKIVVPVDFSGNSVLAAREAAVLAERFEAEVTLLHVAEFPTARFLGPLGYGVASPGSIREEFLAERRRELDGFALSEFPAGKAKRVMCCGSAVNGIVSRAQAEDADLIVMTTHGYGPVRRMLLGSVTAKVLHDCDRPVWTTRAETEGARGPLDIRRVLCAVDFRPHDANTVRWASDFAEAFDAKLTLVHAILPVPPEMPERYAFTWHDEVRWGADERLRALLAETQIAADVAVVEGEAPAALASAAAEHRADVLIAGRSRATSKRGRLGDRSYGIVCLAGCPVVCL